MPLILTIMDEKNYNSFDPERLKNFWQEAEEIITKLKTDSEFCMSFFYGKNAKKCNMARLRSKIIMDIKKKQHVTVSEETFNEIVFLAIWRGGSWKTLDSYDGKSTFFAWLRRVAKNAVMEWLTEEHWISGGRVRTVGNTRLAMRSQSQAKCKLVIDELMGGNRHYELLTAIYVDRLTRDDIMEMFDMNAKEFETAKQMADNKLKDALLRSDNYYVAEVLRDKSKAVVMVSSEFVADMAEWCKTKTGTNPLADVFGINLTEEEVRMKTVEFLYDFSDRMKWSEQDRYIWTQRFVENKPPVDLAQEVGRSRGWLDTRYSRLNKKFDRAIKKWWGAFAA